ncbi:MAG: hypothetical protein J6I40_01060 [Mailhella sp.]|nr:hypothetical protein [Mailhella sp.]
MIITCLGDSLTYGYGVDRAHTWCALASQLTGHSFINCGVNGALSDEIAAHPFWGDELFVMGGLNDIFMGRNISVPLEGLRALCRKASDLGVRPTAGIPMQISPDVDEAWCEGPVDIEKVRAAYAEYADRLVIQCKEDGVRTLDLRQRILPCHLSFDGIHLNLAGHRRMAEAVAEFWPA